MADKIRIPNSNPLNLPKPNSQKSCPAQIFIQDYNKGR